MADKDKRRIDWLSSNGYWCKSYGLLEMVFLPAVLENGQTLRQAIDAAMKARQ